MNSRGQRRINLIPEQGIDIIEGQTVATSCPAWLRIEPTPEVVRQKWIKLRYSASFFDEPIRPLIRFVTGTGETITLPMNGPVLGSAEWIGRVPDGTIGVSISPVRRTGPFTFRLDGLCPIRRTELARQGLRRPDWWFWAARSRLVNSRREAWQALGFATSGTPFCAYAAWHARLVRPIDLDGLDRPRSNWRTGPVFRFVIKLGQADIDRLRHTIRSLRVQVYQRWALHAVTDAKTSPLLVSAFRDQADREPRLSGIPLQLERLEPLTSCFDSNDFVAMIDAGDSVPDYALAVVAETLARDRELELVYSDEDRITSDGDLTAPVLKPDWSPVLHQRVSYLGRLTLLRARSLTTQRLRPLLVDEAGAIDHLANELPRSAIRHVRRILYCRHGATGGEVLPTAARPRRSADAAPRWPEVTVVIPTRDRADLLAECLEGLKHKTDYRKFKTIVVDNGSTAPSAVRLLAEIAALPRITVLRRPGPFNYSALSNDGARAANSRVLVFLNNDIAMLDPGWLKAMVRWAVKPEIGVVGAKLLFPGGLIQHAGVVIGFGGVTGNIYRRLSKDHSDYLAKLTVPREVSAVTAACIAVERLKFEVVGGFDADNLPINLNDVDLCLRMIERGWTNIWTPEATLIHHQSATRGIDRDPFALDRKERAYFEPRWSEAIRDDPYFHPGLSLFCHDIALA